MKSVGRTLSISVLVLLIVVIAPALRPPLCKPSRTPLTATRLLIENVGTACRAYLIEYGTPPTSLDDLVHNPKNLVFIYWGEAGTNDPWGNPIRFNPYDPSLGYGSVMSYGRDGRPGGKEHDADIEVRFGEKRG